MSTAPSLGSQGHLCVVLQDLLQLNNIFKVVAERGISHLKSFAEACTDVRWETFASNASTGKLIDRSRLIAIKCEVFGQGFTCLTSTDSKAILSPSLTSGNTSPWIACTAPGPQMAQIRARNRPCCNLPRRKQAWLTDARAGVSHGR